MYLPITPYMDIISRNSLSSFQHSLSNDLKKRSISINNDLYIQKKNRNRADEEIIINWLPLNMETKSQYFG